MGSDKTLMRPQKQSNRGDAPHLAPSTAPLARFGRWPTWLAVTVLLAAGLTAYANSFRGVFVYDDMASIKDNPYIRTLWPLWEPMSLPLINSGTTVARRPLLSLSFAMNRRLLGAEPWGFHLVNLGIHIASALLLFGIIRRTLSLKRYRSRWGDKATGLALAIALLWEVHPLQTESVTYIVQRAESLMGMLYLATLYCSLRGFTSGRRVSWYTAAVLACAAGMGVKEVMVTAPLMVFLYDGTFISASYREAFRRRWTFYTALAATWSVLLLPQVLGWGEASKNLTNPLAYALTQPGVILYYLRLSFWPSPLVMDYQWPTAEGLLEIVPASCVVAVLLGATAWGLCRRRWYGLVGAWFFLSLAPSSSFVVLSQNLEEHRMYLALAAVVVLTVVAGASLLQRLSAASRPRLVQTAAGALVLVFAAGLTAQTISRNRDYRSQVALWRQNIEDRPLSYVANMNLGMILFHEGRFDEAATCYRRALLIDSTWDVPHLRLANALAMQHQWEEAAPYYRRAVSINPWNWQGYYDFAKSLEAQGKSEEAIENYGMSLMINPRNWAADYRIGNLLADEGHFADAAEHFREALRINPSDAGTHLALGVTLQELGQYVEAGGHFRQAITIDPRNADAHFNLANSLASRGKLHEAVAQYRQSLSIRPDDADAHCNLGATLLQLGMSDEALMRFREATRIDSRHLQAHVMLAKLYLDQGNHKSAIENLHRALEIQPDSEPARQLLQQACGA